MSSELRRMGHRLCSAILLRVTLEAKQYFEKETFEPKWYCLQVCHTSLF